MPDSFDAAADAEGIICHVTAEQGSKRYQTIGAAKPQKPAQSTGSILIAPASRSLFATIYDRLLAFALSDTAPT